MTTGQVRSDVAARRCAVRSTTRRRLLVAMTVAGHGAAEIDGLRRALGGSGLGRIAPHITLVPPVNVADSHLGDVLRRIRSVATEEPAEVVVGPARTFAPRTPVVYLEVAGDTARIADLRRRLAVPPLVPSVPRSERPFVPHVTIGGRVAGPKIAAAVAMLAEFRLAMELSTVALCEQDEIAPRRPWRVIADVVLGSGSTVGRGGREISFVGSTILDPEVAAWAALTPGEDAIGEGATTPSAEDPFVLVAYEAERPVGAVVGSLHGPTVEIHKVRVGENRRNEGIGGQLVRGLERAVATRGCSRVAFVAFADGPLDGFLSHLGYAPTAMRKGRDGEDRVTLERLIS
ncbi:MAG: GNAT family N-acetyltransferase [Acidimicrobiales bacterium]